MDHMRTCPRCGHVNTATNSFCPACGEGLRTGGGRHGWKLLVGALLLFAGTIWAAALYTQTRETTPRPKASVGAETASTPPTGQAELTSAQHLAAAKKALADGYRPHRDPKKTSWGEVATARWHLRSINSGAAEYREALVLLKEVARRERQIELTAKGKAAPAPEQTPERSEEARGGGPAASSAVPATGPPAGEQDATGGRNRRAGTGGSSDDYYTNVEGVRVRRPTFSEGGPPSGATAQCRDGSYSFSRNRRGTCSHHGGVARWL